MKLIQIKRQQIQWQASEYNLRILNKILSTFFLLYYKNLNLIILFKFINYIIIKNISHKLHTITKNMLRLITTRITPRFSQLTKIIKLPPTTNDISNTLGYLNTSSDAPTMTMFQKLSTFSFPNMYESLDLFSRDLLFTFANDYHLGLPIGVIGISFFIRFAFFYANVKGQVGAMKMQQMKPYMDAFQQKSRIAQMTRNFNMLKSARQQLKQAQKKKGIDNFYALINLAQLPFLITWFLSLRYVASLPQLFPSVTQGFLWVSDLSAYDPYFILPLISACLTSYSIHISPTLKSKTVMPLFEPYVKYFKWFPFFSLPFTGFFPALVNLYWASIACNQAFLMIVMNSNYIRNKFVFTEQASKPQILQAVFVEEKPKVKSKSNTIDSQKLTIQNNPNIQTLQILTTKPKKPKKSQK